MNIETKAENLPGVDVVFLGLYYPDLADPENSKFADGVRKLGYILDEEERADEYLTWWLHWIDQIRSRVERVPDEDRPKVLICAYPYAHLDTGTFRTYSSSTPSLRWRSWQAERLWRRISPSSSGRRTTST